MMCALPASDVRRRELNTCCAVCEHSGVPVHGRDREWLGVGCHSLLGVLHVQGHGCAVQLMGRGGLLAGAAGVLAPAFLALIEHSHTTCDFLSWHHRALIVCRTGLLSACDGLACSTDTPLPHAYHSKALYIDTVLALAEGPKSSCRSTCLQGHTAATDILPAE